MNFKPRYYQTDSIDIGLGVLLNNRKELIVVPCAGGKSYIIAGIASKLKTENILVVQPSEELLIQNIAKIQELGVYPSVYSSSLDRKETGKIIYATPKSLTYEVFKDLNIKYVIVDEADFSTQPGTEFTKLLSKLGIKACLGLTATPVYLQNSQDGAITKVIPEVKNSFFTGIAHVVQIEELVKNNFWSDIKYYNRFKPDSQELLKLNTTGSDFTEKSQETFFEKENLATEVSTFLQRLPEGEDALVFVPSIKNATQLQELIPDSIIISSKTKKKERKQLVEDFKSGKCKVCITVLAVAVGFDKPSLKNIIDCSPTNSFRLNMQKIGRGVRIAKDKDFCRIIDFSGNYKRFGDIRDISIEKIKNHGWSVLSNGILLTDIPMDSNKKYTKDFLEKGGKVEINYVFGEHNKGDAKMSVGKYKNKTVKELYYKKRFYLKWLIDNNFEFKEDDKKFEEQLKLIFC